MPELSQDRAALAIELRQLRIVVRAQSRLMMRYPALYCMVQKTQGHSAIADPARALADLWHDAQEVARMGDYPSDLPETFAATDPDCPVEFPPFAAIPVRADRLAALIAAAEDVYFDWVGSDDRTPARDAAVSRLGWARAGLPGWDCLLRVVAPWSVAPPDDEPGREG